jgi:hypothetical protein
VKELDLDAPGQRTASRIQVGPSSKLKAWLARDKPIGRVELLFQFGGYGEMRILKAQMMRENELSKVGKALVTGIVILLCVGAAIRLGQGEVRHPGSLWIVALGLILFLIAKLSVIFRGKWISFGSRPMTDGMGNTYRLGYWLMIVGILIMFA